jgi:shikimate dehydrogenase
MHPNTETTIATAEELHSNLTVFDIVYNPLETRLLREAKTAGAKTISGLLMLVYQGAEAFRLWTGTEPPVELMKKAVLDALQA